MPHKSQGTGGGTGVTTNDISYVINTTDPLNPKLDLTSNVSGLSDIVSIPLEEISNTGNSGLSSISTTDSSSIDFSGDGSTTTPLSANAKISTTAGNTLTTDANGLFVPTPATGGGISSDLGQRLILGSDNKAFEDISGHLVHIETLQEKISFSFDPKTAKPTAAASAGGNSTSTPNTGYFGSFVSFLFKFESGNITLPTLPAGYSYLSVINIHCLVNNGSQQPYPFKVLINGAMDGGVNFGGTDSQCAYILPPMTAELAPNYSNNISNQLSTYQAKNFSIERDINYQSNNILASNVSKLMGEMSFVLPCEGGQAFLKFNNNIDVQELKYEICFYAMKNTKINQTGTITAPALQI